MLTITIFGTGNVARHLFDAFLDYPNKIRVVQVVGRSTTALSYFKTHTSIATKQDVLLQSDICIIAVNDDAIASVSQRIESKNCIIVHTSGSQSINLLNTHRRSGVFYPLQSFSKDLELDFKTIPICIEATNKKDTQLLLQLGEIISTQVVLMQSEQRKSMHLAAVFVNNFTNHLCTIAHEVCKEQELPFELLQPLLKETVNKLDHLSPFLAQTGPAKRGDLSTMEAHLKLLTKTAHKTLYRHISNSIKATHE